MIIKKAMLVLGGLGISCCALAKDTVKSVGVDYVVANAKILEGKEVSVAGYLRFGDDSRNLWANKKAYVSVASGSAGTNGPDWSRCITIYDLSSWRNKLLHMNKSNVVITGTVKSVPLEDGEIRTGSCSDLGVSIKAISKLRPA